MSEVSRSHNPRVLFFTTYVSLQSGASYALRETIRRVQLAGVIPSLLIPDAAESREMFPATEFDVCHVPIARPRKTLNPLTHTKYLLSFPRTLQALRSTIRKKQIDLVHFNEITDVIAGMAARSCRIKSVCHVRADRPSNPYRWLLLSALQRTVDAIIVPSKATESWIAGESRELAARTRLIYDYAFDVNEYRQPVSRSAFRSELGLVHDDILVVLVSKLVAIKGHQLFIRAAQLVRRKSQNVFFVIVGDPVPGHEDESAEIRSLAENLVPTPALRLTGPRRDLPTIYAACDIAVHCPVFHDTYPTVVLLPMLAGRAVIGTAIGGIPEQIQHGRTGLLTRENDPEALAKAIMHLASNREKREALGSAAQKQMFNNLDPAVQGRHLADLYRGILHPLGSHANAAANQPPTQTLRIIEP